MSFLFAQYTGCCYSVSRIAYAGDEQATELPIYLLLILTRLRKVEASRPHSRFELLAGTPVY